MKIRALRNKIAKLTSEELALRREAQDIYTLAEADQDSVLTDEQKARDDAIKARIAAIKDERETCEAQIANAERIADIERMQSGTPSPVTSDVRESILDDDTRGYPTLGHFALAVRNAGDSPHANAELVRRAQYRGAAGDGMEQGVTAEGGVLVPPAYARQVWDGARTMSDSLMGYCDVQPLDGGVQSVEVPAIAETSRADGSRWGGVRGYWKGELATMTPTKPTFRSVKHEPQELYVFAYISDKLLRNAPGFASGILATAAADELNFKIGAAIFDGDGVGKPLGFHQHASVVTVAKEGSQSADTIVAANIHKMYARCHLAWRAGAAWFINQDCDAQLQALVDAGSNSLYLPPGGINDAPNARLKGLPVIPIEYAKTLGDVGDITLANLKCYRVVPKGGINGAESMHLKFDVAQTAFRWIMEIDGQPMLNSAITPYQGSDTISPIVQLAARA